jgi:hypothetical protein
MYIKQISRREDLKNKPTLDDRLDAQDGSHPVLRIPAAIPPGAALLLQNH